MGKQRKSLSEFDLEERPVWAWIMRIAGTVTAVVTPIAFLWPTTAFQTGWLVTFGVAGAVFVVALGVARPDAIAPNEVPWKID